MSRHRESLRVAAITNMYPTAADASKGTFIEQQVKGLQARGIDVNVVVFDRTQGLSVYRSVRRRISETISSYRPDLVHVMYGGALAELVTRVRRARPVVVSFCGSDLLGDVGRGFLLRNTLGKYGVWASHLAARRANGIVVKSKVLREALPQAVPQDKVWTLPNGVDLERFKMMNRGVCQGHLGWPSERFHVLFPGGTHNPRKRLPLASAAVALLQQAGVPVELQILEDVAHDQVPLWINAADVLVLSSIHEGSPNIIKEALACNVPIVSVDVGDVRERIEGVEGCYLVGDTPKELAVGLRAVFTGRRRVEGRAAVQELSIERIADRLIEVYETVLGRKPFNRVHPEGMPIAGVVGD